MVLYTSATCHLYDGASVNSRKKKIQFFFLQRFSKNSRKKFFNFFSPFFQKQQEKKIKFFFSNTFPKTAEFFF